MVPKSGVQSILDNSAILKDSVLLHNIGARSRIGKGTCQGTFCAQRIAAYLYDIEEMTAKEGLESTRAFISERWRGERPLLWDTSLIQAELKEALYCGLFGLERHD